MASDKVELGGNMMMGRHKDICGVLGKWRQVVKDVQRNGSLFQLDSIDGNIQTLLQRNGNINWNVGACSNKCAKPR
jgi:hypothetical protein